MNLGTELNLSVPFKIISQFVLNIWSKLILLHVKRGEDDEDEGLKSSVDAIVYITRAGGLAFLCPACPTVSSGLWGPVTVAMSGPGWRGGGVSMCIP